MENISAKLENIEVCVVNFWQPKDWVKHKYQKLCLATLNCFGITCFSCQLEIFRPNNTKLIQLNLFTIKCNPLERVGLPNIITRNTLDCVHMNLVPRTQLGIICWTKGYWLIAKLNPQIQKEARKERLVDELDFENHPLDLSCPSAHT